MLKEIIWERLRPKLESWLDPELEVRLNRLDADLNEFGVDPFGLDPTYIRTFLPLARILYEKYFRVSVEGIDRLPKGKVLLVSNHSGQIPMDAVMIIVSVLLQAEPPRMIRSMLETWVSTLPVVNTFFSRTGQIIGTRDNCKRLLEHGEAILVFPEGVRGISKTYDQRYRLQEFGLGFMRIALMTHAPIMPVAVVGAEEQAPSFWNAKPIANLLGLPSFPITPTFPWLGPLGMIPYPSKYTIYFGEPMHFDGNADGEDVLIEQKVSVVKDAVQNMLKQGLEARKRAFD